MRIKDIFDLNILEESTLVSGEGGLNNRINNATLIDAPDGFKWCNSGDFIVTTGYPFVHNSSNNNLIWLLQKLIEKKCAGIGIKISRYIRTLPDEFLNIAEENNFPVLILPEEISWSEITYPIISNIISLQQKELKQINDIYLKYQIFLKKQGNIQQLANLLSEILKKDVIFYIKDFDSLHHNAGNVNILNTEELEKIISYGEQNYSDFITYLWRKIHLKIKFIYDNHEVQGVLIILNHNDTLTTWEIAAIEQSSALLSLEKEKLKYISSTLRKFKDKLIMDVISEHNYTFETMYKKAQELNIHLNQSYQLLLFNIYYDRNATAYNLGELKLKINVLNHLEKRILNNYTDCLIGMDENGKIVIFIPNKKNSQLIIDYLYNYLVKSELKNITVGISRFHDTTKLYRAYKEAKSSEQKSYHQLVNSDDTSSNRYPILNYFESMHIEKIIFTDKPKTEIDNLFKEHIIPLKEHDLKNKSELFKTLKVYLNANLDITKTAQLLIIHENTVRYRIKLIEKITGLNFKEIKHILLARLILYNF